MRLCSSIKHNIYRLSPSKARLVGAALMAAAMACNGSLASLSLWMAGPNSAGRWSAQSKRSTR